MAVLSILGDLLVKWPITILILISIFLFESIVQSVVSSRRLRHFDDLPGQSTAKHGYFTRHSPGGFI
jgi:hypothetical protein